MVIKHNLVVIGCFIALSMGDVWASNTKKNENSLSEKSSNQKTSNTLAKQIYTASIQEVISEYKKSKNNKSANTWTDWYAAKTMNPELEKTKFPDIQYCEVTQLMGPSKLDDILYQCMLYQTGASPKLPDSYNGVIIFIDAQGGYFDVPASKNYEVGFQDQAIFKQYTGENHIDFLKKMKDNYASITVQKSNFTREHNKTHCNYRFLNSATKQYIELKVFRSKKNW